MKMKREKKNNKKINKKTTKKFETTTSILYI